MLQEVLSVINSNNDVVSSLKSIFHLPFISTYLKLSVSEDWTDIDIKKIETTKYNYHISMAGAFLLNRHTFKIITEVIMNPDVLYQTKVSQYKALSEMLFVDESKILDAILNKNITSIYPNITFEKINCALSFLPVKI